MYYALTPAAIRSVDCIIIPTGAVGYRPVFLKGNLELMSVRVSQECRPLGPTSPATPRKFKFKSYYSGSFRGTASTADISVASI